MVLMKGSEGMNREKVIQGLRCIKGDTIPCRECGYADEDGYGNYSCKINCAIDAIALLKEQEAVVKQWTKEIADNQLAHAPDELDRENWDYKKGIWDGLQIAWNIISEGR